VFLAVFRSLPRFRFERPFAHWLSTVTPNACRMVLRRRAQEHRGRQAMDRHRVGESAPAPEPGLRALVLELLDALEPGTRIPILMHFGEGCSHAEIAAELELGFAARIPAGPRARRDPHTAFCVFLLLKAVDSMKKPAPRAGLPGRAAPAPAAATHRSPARVASAGDTLPT
jgi:hypothetical protein